MPAAAPERATGALVGAINGNCFGTPTEPGDQIDTHEFTQGLINPLTRGNLYARVSYDLTPDTEVYATLIYSGVRTENTPAQGNSDKSGTIHCDNAYLPQTGLFGVGLTAAQTPGGLPGRLSHRATRRRASSTSAMASPSAATGPIS